jgi:hypothetical protein
MVTVLPFGGDGSGFLASNPLAGRCDMQIFVCGNADRILENIARQMQEDAELALEELISRIEPALVLAASVLVGSILLSVMLPLMQILTALG